MARQPKVQLTFQVTPEQANLIEKAAKASLQGTGDTVSGFIRSAVLQSASMVYNNHCVDMGLEEERQQIDGICGYRLCTPEEMEASRQAYEAEQARYREFITFREALKRYGTDPTKVAASAVADGWVLLVHSAGFGRGPKAPEGEQR